MSSDEYTVWCESINYEGYVRKFLHSKKLMDDFESWLYEEFVSERASEDDYIHETIKDEVESQ